MEERKTKYQVVEKDGFGVDWHQVRYNAYAMRRFDSQEEAVKAAKEYLTEINCNNALTKTEKKAGAEAFMMIPHPQIEGQEACFLGVLDEEDWYLVDRHGKIVTDPKYFELEGKAEIIVRPVPGT